MDPWARQADQNTKTRISRPVYDPMAKMQTYLKNLPEMLIRSAENHIKPNHFARIIYVEIVELSDENPTDLDTASADQQITLKVSLDPEALH